MLTNSEPIRTTQGEQGFSNIFIVVIAVVVIGIGGYFVLMNSGTVVAPTDTPTTTPSPSASTNPGNGVVCTQDAKLCPDGSYVGRTGPKCEFRACPEIKWTTYSSSQYNFSLQYPADWNKKSDSQESIIFYKKLGEHENEIYLVMENNPNRLTTQGWLQAVGIDTSKAETLQINGLAAIRLVDNASVPTAHIYIATGEKVVHFFVEQQTSYKEIFNQVVGSFKLTN